MRVFGCPVSFRRHAPTSQGRRIPKKQQTQRSSIRGIFIGFPLKQAGHLTCLEDRIGTTHITVSNDVTFDERFKSAIAMTHRPFPGAQHMRQIGPDTMSVLLNDADDIMHTGSVDDVLRTRHGTSARGENGEDLSSPNPEQDPDSNDDDGNPTCYYNDILDHQQMDDGHYKFQAEWNTGEITWEPAKCLKEDAPGDLEQFILELRQEKPTRPNVDYV